MSDYDSPWKEALDRYFQWFIAFFFPKAYADIDWTRGYEMLDTEFQKVIREAVVGQHRADKLVKVWLKNGEEAWLLIHVEVQSQYDAEFPQRMFIYNIRAFDLYRRTVVSLAVLGDDSRTWRPRGFRYGRWGCGSGTRFRMVKLLDYAADLTALETNPNPFAALVLAHLKTRETSHDSDARRLWKVRLVKGLFERGWSKDDVRELFRLIDWMMDLPPAMERQVWREIQQYEKEKHMPYITSVERIGREEGLREGKREGLLECIELRLQSKFGAEGSQLFPIIQAVTDVDKLRAIYRAIETATSQDEIRLLCA
jgi:hypothetical protein